MKAKDPSELDRLRTRIEDALRRERPRNEVIPLLSRLLASAAEHSELFVYAHRHMAELLITDEPWQSALHLRQVMRAGAADDTTHALMGLCQALLGNFDSAVYQYERALILDPENAWYHHNLGHLLDVALNRPEAAAKHLQRAHDAHPMEDEVTASLSHCLARLGQLERAGALAQEALDLSPDHESHGSLLSWIKRGAPGGFLFSADHAFHGRDPRKNEELGSENDRDVLRALERGMQAGGAPAALLSRAERVWRDYRARRPRVRVAKPEVHAAALEYAVSVMHGITGVTQTNVAKRYGISSTALASRYTDMRATLALTVGDPRYLR
jgi:tetratricopeptide (TPR) repeat protein